MKRFIIPTRLVWAVSSLRRFLLKPRFRIEPVRHPGDKQLLVDVSTIIRSDVRTGIQRVVRALLGQLVSADIPGVIVQPVFASRNHGFCRAAFHSDGRLVNASEHPRGLQPVEVRGGDIFLGLDLAAHTLPALESVLATWRRKGVTINMVIYDLLPISRPDWFSSRLIRNFHRWLDVVARQSDRCICISDTVAQALAEELLAHNPTHLPAVLTIPLGSDLDSSFPSLGLPDNISAIRGLVRVRRALLAVGTVEPRKGYDCLLDALDHIWRSDPESDIALLIVGRAGWSTKKLQQRVRDHPEHGNRLVWLDQATDELLSELYRHCVGLIAASHQEGFGLPLIEAAAHGTPILARDLPVFREVGGELFDYFDNDAPEPLAARIKDWLASTRRPSLAERDALPRWSNSATALQVHLGLTKFSQVAVP